MQYETGRSQIKKRISGSQNKICVPSNRSENIISTIYEQEQIKLINSLASLIKNFYHGTNDSFSKIKNIINNCEAKNSKNLMPPEFFFISTSVFNVEKTIIDFFNKARLSFKEMKDKRNEYLEAIRRDEIINFHLERKQNFMSPTHQFEDNLINPSGKFHDTNEKIKSREYNAINVGSNNIIKEKHKINLQKKNNINQITKEGNKMGKEEINFVNNVNNLLNNLKLMQKSNSKFNDIISKQGIDKQISELSKSSLSIKSISMNTNNSSSKSISHNNNSNTKLNTINNNGPQLNKVLSIPKTKREERLGKTHSSKYIKTCPNVIGQKTKEDNDNDNNNDNNNDSDNDNNNTISLRERFYYASIPKENLNLKNENEQLKLQLNTIHSSYLPYEQKNKKENLKQYVKELEERMETLEKENSNLNNNIHTCQTEQHLKSMSYTLPFKKKGVSKKQKNKPLSLSLTGTEIYIPKTTEATRRKDKYDIIVSNYEQKIDQMSLELDNLQNLNITELKKLRESYEDALERDKTEKKNLLIELNRFKSTEKALNISIVQLKEEINNKEKEINAFKEQKLKDEKKINEQKEKNALLTEKLKKFTQDTELKIEKIKTSHREQIELLQHSITDVTEKLLQKAKIQNDMTNEIQKSNDTILSLHSKITELETQIEQYNDKGENQIKIEKVLRESITTKDIIIDNKDKEIQHLKQLVSKNESEVEEYKDKTNKLIKDYNECSSKLKSTIENMNDLQKKFNVLNNQKEEVDKKNNEIMSNCIENTNQIKLLKEEKSKQNELIDKKSLYISELENMINCLNKKNTQLNENLHNEQMKYEKEINNYKSQIDLKENNFQIEKSSLVKQLSYLKLNNSKMESELKTLTTLINDKTASLSDKEDNINKLKDKVNSLTQLGDDYKKSNAKLEEDNNILIEKVTSLSNKINELTQNKDTLSKINIKQTEDIAKLNSQIKELSNANKDISNIIKEKDLQMQTISEQQEKSKNEISILKTTIIDKDNIINKYEIKVNDITGILDEERINKEVQDEKVKILEKENNDIKQNKKKQLDSKDKEISLLNKSILAKAQQIAQCEDELKEKNITITQMENTIKDKSNHINELQSTLTDKNTQIEKLLTENAKCKLIEDNFTKSQSIIKDLEYKLKQSNEYVTNNKEEINLIKQSLREYEDRTVNKEEEIANKNKMLNDKEAQIDLLEKSLQEKILQNENIISNLQEKQNEINSNEDTIKEQESIIKNLKIQIEELQKDKKEIKENFEIKNSLNKTLISQLEIKLQEETEKVANGEKCILSLKTQNDSLTSDINSLNKEKNDLISEINILKSEISKYKSHYNTMTSQIKESNDQRELITSALENLKDKYKTEIENNIKKDKDCSELRNNIISLQSEHSKTKNSLNEQISTLNSTIEDLNTKIEQITLKNQNLQQLLKQNDDKIQSLSNINENLKSQNESNDNKTNQLTQMIKELEKQILQMKDKYNDNKEEEEKNQFDDITPEKYQIVKCARYSKKMQWYLLKENSTSNNNKDNFSQFIWLPINNKKDFSSFKDIPKDTSFELKREIENLQNYQSGLLDKLTKKETEYNKLNLQFVKLINKAKPAGKDIAQEKLVEMVEQLKKENKVLQEALEEEKREHRERSNNNDHVVSFITNRSNDSQFIDEANFEEIITEMAKSKNYTGSNSNTTVLSKKTQGEIKTEFRKLISEIQLTQKIKALIATILKQLTMTDDDIYQLVGRYHGVIALAK